MNLKDKIQRTGLMPEIINVFEEKDVKQAVLKKQKRIHERINELKQFDEGSVYTTESIISFLENDLIENCEILGDFEQ